MAVHHLGINAGGFGLQAQLVSRYATLLSEALHIVFISIWVLVRVNRLLFYWLSRHMYPGYFSKIVIHVRNTVL